MGHVTSVESIGSRDVTRHWGGRVGALTYETDTGLLQSMRHGYGNGYLHTSGTGLVSVLFSVSVVDRKDPKGKRTLDGEDGPLESPPTVYHHSRHINELPSLPTSSLTSLYPSRRPYCLSVSNGSFCGVWIETKRGTLETLHHPQWRRKIKEKRCYALYVYGWRNSFSRVTDRVSFTNLRTTYIVILQHTLLRNIYDFVVTILKNDFMRFAFSFPMCIGVFQPPPTFRVGCPSDLLEKFRVWNKFYTSVSKRKSRYYIRLNKFSINL